MSVSGTFLNGKYAMGRNLIAITLQKLSNYTAISILSQGKSYQIGAQKRPFRGIFTLLFIAYIHKTLTVRRFHFSEKLRYFEPKENNFQIRDSPSTTKYQSVRKRRVFVTL